MKTLICSCGKEYGVANWQLRTGRGKFCSKRCAYDNKPVTGGFQKGHPVYGGIETQFKKGQTPWNEGTRGVIKPNSGSFKPGEHNSPDTEFKVGQFSDENHPWWKGDAVGYFALHTWVQRKLGKASKCEHCGKTEGLFDWANKSREYHRDLEDWISLCKKCHGAYDSGENRGKATLKYGRLY